MEVCKAVEAKARWTDMEKEGVRKQSEQTGEEVQEEERGQGDVHRPQEGALGLANLRVTYLCKLLPLK